MLCITKKLSIAFYPQRWADRMNEPEVGTTSLVLCRLQTKRLA